MSEETNIQSQHHPEAHGQEEGSADDTDLLIRSTSTILHLVGRRVTDSKDRPGNAQGHFLDRIALSFVSGLRPADVAAAVYWDNANHQLFVDAVKESHGYDLIRNRSWRVASTHGGTPSDLMRLLEEDMITFLHLWGVDAITLGMHAQKLQSLLNAMHQGEEAQATAAEEELPQYIYTFCAHKFWERLKAHPPGYEQVMLRFFLNEAYSGPNLSPEQLARDIPPPSKLKDKSEAWLSDIFQRAGQGIPCHEVDLGEERTVQHLALDKENIWHLYSLFTRVLLALRTNLLNIKPLARGTGRTANLGQAEREIFIKATTTIHASCSLIYDLMHKSPSFWRMIELIGSTIPSPNPNHPARTSPLPSALRTQPGSQLASHDEDGKTTEVIQDDETEVAEDEIGLIKYRTFAELCGRWLDSITQWFHAMEDLRDRADIRAIVKQGLVIRARDATPPEDRHRQMPLMRTLEQVSGRNLEEVLSAIRELAKNKAKSLRLNNSTQPTTGKDSYLALKVLAGFPEAPLEDWKGAFSGAVHCEADLACQMAIQHKEVKDGLIGVSKRCCFCCNVLLKHLGLDSTSLPTHGKIYYWAPPPTATAEAKQVVLKALLTQLEMVIEDFYSEKEENRPRTGDSGQGSESGRVSHKKLDPVKFFWD